MKPIYKVTVEITREEETLTSRPYIPENERSKEMLENGEAYGPQAFEVKRVSREIFMQEVQDLDLVAVINAINKQ